MKFGKRLKKQVEESLPGWRDKFLAYKRLKVLVRLVSTDHGSGSSSHRAAAEAAFVRLLNDEVDRSNAFFLELEEEFVIHHRGGEGDGEGGGRRGTIGDEQGEEGDRGFARGDGAAANYNYTGLAKILKKYDKRTGRLLRLPFIGEVLKQPFFTTELTSRLVRDCEATMEAMFAPSASGDPWTNHCTNAETAPMATEQGIFRSTVAAPVAMRELRSGSSTHGQCRHWHQTPPCQSKTCYCPSRCQII